MTGYIFLTDFNDFQRFQCVGCVFCVGFNARVRFFAFVSTRTCVARVSWLIDSLTINNVGNLINSNIAISGDTAWHNSDQTHSYSNYKYLIVTCGCHGCTYNSLIIPTAILSKKSGALRVSAYWDLNNQGCMEIYKTGRIYVFAKTQNYAFDFIVQYAD